MSIYVYRYVHIYIYMYIYVYIYIYICIYVYIYMSIYMSICLYICIYSKRDCTWYTHAPNSGVEVDRVVCMYIYIYIYIYIQTYIYIHIHTYIYMYIQRGIMHLVHPFAEFWCWSRLNHPAVGRDPHRGLLSVATVWALRQERRRERGAGRGPEMTTRRDLLKVPCSY